MEKLIELLNEYAYGENKELYYRDAEIVDLNSDRVISKKFGFIKWLVDNDKIDLDKVKDKTIVKEVYEDYNSDLGMSADFYSIYESLLMLLSISDTPIEDLISYLK